MSQAAETGRAVVEAPDRAALKHEEEAVEVASQWAQEKLENFLLEVENSNNDHKLLKISYIISRRTSIDVFSAKSNDLGDFVKDIISSISGDNVLKSIGNLAVTFDELGGLNRLDGFFFCYRFASSGLMQFSKAVIGTCIVRSAASMVDDNAYRVVLTSSATLSGDSRKSIAKHMVAVAKLQNTAIVEGGGVVEMKPTLLEARAELAAAIGEGVATSEQYKERTTAKTPFKVGDSNDSAETQAKGLAASTSTVTNDDDKETARTTEEKQNRKEIEASAA